MKKHPLQNRTNVQIKGGGGQRPFEQCSKKLHFFERGASLSHKCQTCDVLIVGCFLQYLLDIAPPLAFSLLLCWANSLFSFFDLCVCRMDCSWAPDLFTFALDTIHNSIQQCIQHLTYSPLLTFLFHVLPTDATSSENPMMRMMILMTGV